MILLGHIMKQAEPNIPEQMQAILDSGDAAAIAILAIEVNAIYGHLRVADDPERNQHSQQLL